MNIDRWGVWCTPLFESATDPCGGRIVEAHWASGPDDDLVLYETVAKHMAQYLNEALPNWSHEARRYEEPPIGRVCVPPIISATSAAAIDAIAKAAVAKMKDPVFPTDLDAVQKLCDAATPGPWRYDTYGASAVIYSGTKIIDSVASVDAPSCGEDEGRAIVRGNAALIINARTLVPQMAAEIRELRAELAAERARTDALVASLPKCGWCGSVATKAFERGGTRCCDDCVRSMVLPDYPRAAPLRAIAHARRLAAGGEEKSG